MSADQQSAEGSRRDFLGVTWKALGAVACAEFCGVLGAFVWARKSAGSGEEGEGVMEVGAVGDFTPASVTAFPGGRFYLVRLADGGFLAMSSRCTHLGCMVPWSEQTKTFPCPCHASVFDITGEVLAAPAPRALDLHPVAIQGGVLKVDAGKRIQRSHFDRSQVTYL